MMDPNLTPEELEAHRRQNVSKAIACLTAWFDAENDDEMNTFMAQIAREYASTYDDALDLIGGMQSVCIAVLRWLGQARHVQPESILPMIAQHFGGA
jgi:hypothetical protein